MQRVIVMTVLAVLVSASMAWGEPVEALWQLRADETLEEGMQRATRHALNEAVYQRSLELLPGEPGEQRKELLREYLDRNGGRLAQVRGEPSLSERVEGMVLRMDIEVDDSALRGLLQRIGIFFTIDVTLPYSLSMEGGKGGSAALISRLETLSGVVQEPGANPTLSLRHDGVLWKGAMQGAHGAYEAAGSDLATLWSTLWGWYFTVHGPSAASDGASAGQGMQGDAQLVVEGFSSPGDVYAFEQVLRGFMPAIAGASLKGMDMKPEGIAAIWNVSLQDEALLRQRLDAYTPRHGLNYQLMGGPGETPAPAFSPAQPAAGQTPSATPPAETSPEPAPVPEAQAPAAPPVDGAQ